jgi:hypothetical protein
MVSQQEGPTRSPQTNAIIAACQQVLDGTKAYGELLEMAKAREASMEQAKCEFVAKIAEDGEIHTQIFQQEIEAVLSAFEEYRGSLGEIVQFGTDNDGAHLQSAIAILTVSAPKVMDAIEAYDAKYATVGPTTFPIVNMLMRGVESFKAGKMGKDFFTTMVRNGREQIRKALVEAEGNTKPELKDFTTLLIGNYRVFIEGFDELEKFIETGDEGLAKAGLEKIEDAHKGIHTGFQEQFNKKFNESPTKQPLANWVINAAAEFKAGRLTLDMLKSAVESENANYQEMKKKFMEIARVPTDSISVKEEIPKAMEAFDLHDEAVSEFDQFFQNQNQALLDSAVSKLRTSADRLVECYDHFMEISEMEGKVLCPRCNHPNQIGSKSCAKCHAALPKMMEGEMSSFGIQEGQELDMDELGFVATENFQSIMKSTEQAMRGEMSPDEFAGVLSWMEGLVTNAESQLKQAPSIPTSNLPPEQAEIARQAADLLDETKTVMNEGLAEFQSGVRTMHDFLSDGNAEHLKEGFQMIFEGSKKIYRAQKVGEMMARKVDEEMQRAPGETASTSPVETESAEGEGGFNLEDSYRQS